MTLRGHLAVALATLALGTCASASVIYVSPSGAAKNPGTQAQPVSLSAALAKASADREVTEIVLAGGEYVADGLNLGARAAEKQDGYPPLLIHAAKGETAWLVHSVRVDKAEPVEGARGVFRTRSVPPGDPEMWERDTRVRYITLTTAASVAAFPASCFADPEAGFLYFHTSDGQPPEKHALFYSLGTPNGRALGVYRPNTSIEDIGFRDACGSTTHALVMNAAGLAARRLRFDNAFIGIGLGTYAVDNLIEDCVFVDVAQGIRSSGKDLTIRRCHITKERDAFFYRVYPSLDTAVYTYFPGSGTTITETFAKGYKQGFRVKATPGRYVIRHNTVVDAETGMYWVTSNADSDTSYNIFANADEFIRVSEFEPTFTLDRNLYWASRNLLQFDVRNTVVRGAGLGKRDLFADPRFVDPDKGDYRVLEDSPAVFLKDGEGRPAGAFGVAPVSEAAKARPSLALAFGPDTVACGPTGELVFERDPWIGGGRTMLRELRGEDGAQRRLAGQTSAKVWVRAFDAAGKVDRMRVAVGGQAPVEQDYAPVTTVPIPDQDGEHRLKVEVRNDRGAWSRPAEAVLRLDRQPPQLAGAPEIMASGHGLVVAFQTSEPCFAEVRYTVDGGADGVAKPPVRVKRQWESQDGGEYVETWTLPRNEFAIAVTAPAVKAGARVRFKIALKDEGGLAGESKEMEAVAAGPARTLRVSPGGQDEPGRGGPDKPLKTLQYAVDRALPGDRVVMAPGVYTDCALVTRGGLGEDSRLVIESETPGAAAIDCAYREPSCIALEQAPFVTVRGLRLLNYERAGLYVHKSPGAVADNCVFYNGDGAVQGYHAFFFLSPSCVVTRCLAVGAETGLMFLVSPKATVTHNTISQSLYAAASYAFSMEGTTQTNNSFCFAGNDAFGGEWRHPDEFKTFRSDYNNLGTVIRDDYVERAKKEAPETYNLIQAAKFKPEYGTRRFPFRTVSKSIITLSGKRYFALEDWRRETGQDKHSVFADPQYVKPFGVVENWDWRVKASSPNAGAGEKGATIGALEAAK